MGKTLNIILGAVAGILLSLLILLFIFIATIFSYSAEVNTLEAPIPHQSIATDDAFLAEVLGEIRSEMDGELWTKWEATWLLFNNQEQIGVIDLSGSPVEDKFTTDGNYRLQVIELYEEYFVVRLVNLTTGEVIHDAFYNTEEITCFQGEQLSLVRRDE